MFVYYNDGHFRTIPEETIKEALKRAVRVYGPGGNLYQRVVTQAAVETPPRFTHQRETRLVDGEFVHMRVLVGVPCQD